MPCDRTRSIPIPLPRSFRGSIDKDGRFRCDKAGFALVASFPVQTNAVVTRLPSSFTIQAMWLLLSAFDLPVLTGPEVRQPRVERSRSGYVYQHPWRLRVFGSGPPGFFGRGIIKEAYSTPVPPVYSFHEICSAIDSRLETMVVEWRGSFTERVESQLHRTPGRGYDRS